MSKFYTEKHRALQEKFETRRTADLMENAVVHSEFGAHEAEFIQSRDMFFRLRVQGVADVLFDHPLLESYPGAQFLIAVAVESIWVNCPRYVHPHRKLEQSRYVPVAGLESPLPAWKRIDIVQEALAKDDRERVSEAGGEITQDAYAELLAKGEA